MSDEKKDLELESQLFQKLLDVAEECNGEEQCAGEGWPCSYHVKKAKKLFDERDSSLAHNSAWLAANGLVKKEDVVEIERKAREELISKIDNYPYLLVFDNEWGEFKKKLSSEAGNAGVCNHDWKFELPEGNGTPYDVCSKCGTKQYPTACPHSPSAQSKCCRQSLSCGGPLLMIADGGKSICANCVDKMQKPSKEEIEKFVAGCAALLKGEKLALDVYDEGDADIAIQRFNPSKPKEMAELMNCCYRSGYMTHAGQPVVFTPALLAEACEQMRHEHSMLKELADSISIRHGVGSSDYPFEFAEKWFGKRGKV